MCVDSILNGFSTVLYLKIHVLQHHGPFTSKEDLTNKAIFTTVLFNETENFPLHFMCGYHLWDVPHIPCISK